MEGAQMHTRAIYLSVALAFFAALFALPTATQAAVDTSETCPITIDNDTSDWDSVDTLVDEDQADIEGTVYYWDGSEWQTEEPESWEYSTNVDQMADPKTIKMCNDVSTMYVYGAWQYPIFGIYSAEDDSYTEFPDPEGSDLGMPQEYDYWFVTAMQKEGSDSLYYYAVHLYAGEGDPGMSEGPQEMALYEDDGDEEFDPTTDTQLVEFEDPNDSTEPEEGEEGEGKEFDQNGGLEVIMALVNDAGVGVFTETDISYGDTVDMTVTMYENSGFEAESTGGGRGLTAVSSTDEFQYTMARAGVQNVKYVKKKRKKKKAQVTWTKVDVADSYRVQLRTFKNKKKLRTVTVTKRKKTLKKLMPKRKYKVRVRAVMGDVKSPWSNYVTIKKKR